MAVVLNGTDQGVNLDAHGASLNFTTVGFSIYIEFATTQTSFQWMIVHGRQQATFETEWGIAIENGSVQGVTTTPDDGLVITSDSAGGTWDDGNLHRVLFVVAAGLGQVELWIDGAQRDTATLTDTDISNINDLTSIGYSSETDVFWLDGELSNAAVWGVDVSADAADLTNGTINPGDLLTGIVEWWPLDFDARGEVNDLDGTLVGAPTFTETGVVAGEISHGLVFGHSVQVDQAVTGQVSHGLVYGHRVDGAVIPSGTIRHGLVFGHQITAHSDAVTVGRPIQPMAAARPIRPLAQGRPIMPVA